MKSFFGQVNSEYLEKAASIFSSVKQDSYRHMDVIEGDIVLDVGCGAGHDAMAIAKLVGSGGKVVGFDHDHTMLNRASQNIAHTCQNRDIVLIQGCASQLPFQSDYFASCRSERLFMHLSTPEQTLSEMLRVIKPGGKIVIIDTDWASLSIDNPLPKIERTLSDFRISHILNNGYSGRSLYRQFKKLELNNIKINVFPVCLTDIELFYYLSMQQTVEDQALASQVVTESELECWRNELHRTAVNGCFYCTINIVMISANKPQAQDEQYRMQTRLI